MATDSTAQAWSAFEARDWVTSRRLFAAARDLGAPSADDVVASATCAWWLGLLDESLTASEEAYRLLVADGRPGDAAMVALQTAYTHGLRGKETAASAWMSRATRLLGDEPESPGHGYLRYLAFEESLGGADPDAARAAALEVRAWGERTGDRNLTALGLLGEGRALVKQGEVARGVRLLDEAMLAAVSDDLDPAWAGNIYCHVMLACYELGDLNRAREWTDATARWCETMPGAGPFMGICRVHRAQLATLQGAWSAAEADLSRVAEELADFHVRIVAEAEYQLGEVRRRQGDLGGAAEAFERARVAGRSPQPGLALLELARGRAGEALISMEAVLPTVAADRLGGAEHLAAMVEIALAAGRLDVGQAASAELVRTAAQFGSSGLDAMASAARGACLLSDERPRDALVALQHACTLWRGLSADYEAARMGVLVARALDGLGSHEQADRERRSAAEELMGMGLQPSAIEALGLDVHRPLPDGLTHREVEVLSLVASGRTNREVADQLVISEKTVARHLSNIFAKVNVSSRTALAAYAFEHGLQATE